MVAATLTELPFWFLSGPLIARSSPNTLIAFGLLMGVVRLFALAVMGAPWLALPISLLHGPSFAVLWAAGVADADTAAPAGLGATAQGLFSGALNGLGSAVGGFFGGLAWGAIGFASLFLTLGWLMVGALLVFVSARMVRRARPAL